MVEKLTEIWNAIDKAFEMFFRSSWGYILLAAISQLTILKDKEEKLTWWKALGIVATVFMLGYAVQGVVDQTKYKHLSILIAALTATFSIPILTFLRKLIIEIGNDPSDIVRIIKSFFGKK